jgi:hypothetical protein
MKVSAVLFLVTLLAVVGEAQYRSMADATYALKGQVRSFKTEVAEFVLTGGDYVEAPRVLQMEASFNQDGNRTDLHLYNDKGELTLRWIGGQQDSPQRSANLSLRRRRLAPEDNNRFP